MTRGRRAVTVGAAARRVLAVVAVLLAVPVAAIGVEDTATLERFHNRVLERWPAGGLLRRDPARYFAAVNAVLADRAYPIVAATGLKQMLAYRLFGASPSPNVTVARDGLVFLNGADTASVDTLVADACVHAAEPETVRRLSTALARLGAFGKARALPIDVMLVPTIPTLAGDRLPRSLPAPLRAACAERAVGHAPLLQVPSPEGLRFVYPFAALRARIGDRAMFPNGNFHPDGLSVKIARDAYLAAIGEAPVRGETVSPARGPSELLQDYGGFDADFPLYRVSGPVLPVDDAATARVKAAVAGRFYDGRADSIFVMTNPAAPNPQSLLVLSDSYGINASVGLAAVFGHVVQMTEPRRDVDAFLDAVGAAVPVSRVLVLFDDANVDRVARLAGALPAAPRS